MKSQSKMTDVGRDLDYYRLNPFNNNLVLFHFKCMYKYLMYLNIALCNFLWYFYNKSKSFKIETKTLFPYVFEKPYLNDLLSSF